MIKAMVAEYEPDQQFIYKKTDNAVILILKMKLPDNFNADKSELCFGFQMKTESLRYNSDRFTMTVPVVINCGKASIKGQDDAKSQASTARSQAVNQS